MFGVFVTFGVLYLLVKRCLMICSRHILSLTPLVVCCCVISYVPTEKLKHLLCSRFPFNYQIQFFKKKKKKEAFLCIWAGYFKVHIHELIVVAHSQCFCIYILACSSRQPCLWPFAIYLVIDHNQKLYRYIFYIENNDLLDP